MQREYVPPFAAIVPLYTTLQTLVFESMKAQQI